MSRKPDTFSRGSLITVGEFTNTNAAREFMRRPGVETVDPRKIGVRGDDWWSAWQAFFL